MTITNTCNICSGVQVLIRSRYPGGPMRLVCPTCLQERMDTINEMTAWGYGRAVQENQA